MAYDIHRIVYLVDGRIIEETIVGPYSDWPKRELIGNHALVPIFLVANIR
jgi:hypothetical protein